MRDGRPVAVRGDRDDPLFRGYTCIKGRQLVETYDHPERIRAPLRRTAAGDFEAVGMEAALDAIAEKLAAIREAHGPRAIASYGGTYAYMESAALHVARGWHQGIGSDSYYTSYTIDQPAKPIAQSRFGSWAGGLHGFEEADVLLIVGCNTVVSQYAPAGGIPCANSYRRYHDAIRRGARVVCVDPRESEVARHAHYFLQIRPGEDPTLLAGMLRLVLEEELHDREFCDRHVEGLDELKAAVAAFTPDYVAHRAGVDAELFATATRTFAGGRKGPAFAGTGPDMAPRANLTEHLILCLNTLLGRHPREGEPSAYPALLAPNPAPRQAHVVPPQPLFGTGPRSRVRGLGQIAGEMPTAALSDEILEPGDGQVRALLCIGGNPVAAWPDRDKARRAMEQLELLVCVDVRLSATSQLADFILPGKICLEREDTAWLLDLACEEPYAHYTQAVCEPNGELIEEWEFYWELARRLGTPIPLVGGPLPMDAKPSKLEVLERTHAGSRVSLAELREHEGGRLYDVQLTVEPADEQAQARFQLAPEGVLEELHEIRAEALLADGRPAVDGEFSHLLVSRRLRHVLNSAGLGTPAIEKQGTTNPAYMNPRDLEALGLAPGAIVEIRGRHGHIRAVLEAAPDVRPGVISMSHAWGGLADDDEDVREVGSNTGRLVATDREYDPITGMARQSAIPVNVRPA